MQMTSDAQEHTGNQHDQEYDSYLEKINQRVATLIADGRCLFHTNSVHPEASSRPKNSHRAGTSPCSRRCSRSARRRTGFPSRT